VRGSLFPFRGETQMGYEMFSREYIFQISKGEIGYFDSNG